MIAYVARRLLFSVFVIFGVTTIVFLVLRLIPGDPATMLLGIDASLEDVNAARERLGLDRAPIVQYAIYLRDIVRLDFGESYRMGVDAWELVVSRVPATVWLATVALLLSLSIGLPLGVWAGLRPHGISDRLITTFSLTMQSLPSFWVGIMLLLLFAGTWGILPTAGSGSWRHVVLPALSLALPFLALLVRLVRSGILDVAHEDYVQTARSKGLREYVVVIRHTLRNALIPVVTVIGLQFGWLLSGTIVVETVFAWPGLGRLLVTAINNRDYTVVQATVIFVSAVFIVVNLTVDILYGYIDPRARVYDGKASAA